MAAKPAYAPPPQYYKTIKIMNEDLKAQIKTLNAQHKAKEELMVIYEQGKQTAHRGASIDNMPRYRKQNKVAAWLKGFTVGQQELQNQKISRSVDKAGLAKLKEVIKQVLEEK